MKGYYVSSFMYIAAIGSVKLSVLVILYTIVAIQRWARRIVVATGVFVLAWSVASILAVAFQCKMPRPWEIDHSQCSNMVGKLDIQRMRGIDIADDLSKFSGSCTAQSTCLQKLLLS